MKTISSFSSKLLALTLALMASVSTFAYEFEYSNDFHIDGFAYKVLPSNTLWPYGAVALIEIADCAADVIIPDTITYTFSNTTVTYIVTTLGGGAALFTNSAKETVKSISIPKGISVINSPLFAGCSNLTSIVVDSENPYYDSRENCNAIITTSQNPYFTPNTLIAGCQTTVIPHSVAEIADKAFYNSALESITIPTGVTKIGRSAFNNSNQLSSVTLPASLKEIGDWAFADCLSLNTIICYALVPPTVSSYTFQGSNPIYNNPTVYVPAESVEAYKNAEHWKWFLQILPIEKNPKDLFPTLWGLRRTHTIEMYDYAPNDGKRSGGYPLPFASVKDTVINGKTYLQFGDYVNGSNYSLFFLREENNKVLIYSSILQEDLVLYDYTLKLGDSLPAITSDHDYFLDDHFTKLDKAENIFTYVVTDVSTVILLDGIERKKWILKNKYLPIIEYVEGVGCYGENTSHSGDFFRLIHDHPYTTEYVGDHLVCVSKNGQLLYSMPQEEMNSFTLTCECLSQEDTIAPKDLFPTLWGLQRTSCDEWFDGCEENKSYLFAPKEITEINGKQYLKCGGVFLREEDSKVLIYSFPYEKDLILYDYTLEVGDTLQNLGIDIYSFPELEYAAVVDYIAYEDYDVETDEFIIKKEPLGSKRVTEVSTITLLDGKEYKRWLFGNDWENGDYYIEGIGNVGGSFGGDYIDIANPYDIPTCYLGERLVCASRNNKLLYQMDPVKMDELGAECLCDYDRGPRKDNAKDGQIGGRPTPTQWNQLEVVLRQMDNNNTILQAETFSYTLEDISQQVNNKTYFQLARQSTKDTATTKSVVGALHFGKDEDNRVYFLRDGVEYVLYDFTAEIGDTVEIFAGINNYPLETTYTHVVVDKDTTEDGACRMFLEVVFPEETTTAENAEKVWLAGLGSVDGIVHNAAKRTSNAHAAPSRSASSSETESSVMLCAWREDSCLYTTNHPDYDTFGCVYNQDPTSVEDVETLGTQYQKILRDGHLYILRDNKLYDVLGTPMN